MISSLIGHAHPNTTAHFYGHLDELVLSESPDYLLNPELDERAVANALGIDGRATRKPNETANSCNLSGLLIQLGHVKVVTMLVKARSTAVLPAIRPSNRQQMSSQETAARILQAAVPGARLECIANRLLLEPLSFLT